jgi:hypothetical protein
MFRIRTEVPLRIRTLINNTYPTPGGCHEFVKNRYSFHIDSDLQLFKPVFLYLRLIVFEQKNYFKIGYILIFIYKIIYWFFFADFLSFNKCSVSQLLDRTVP